jgi:hypothetical protein
MPKRVMRFGVGDASRKLSATTWSCWTNGTGKKDVYVACRAMAGTLKVSLHETGQWHLAFHSENFPSLFADGAAPATRFIDRWQRPRPLASEVTLACRIYTPWNAVTVQQQALESKVTWIAPAPSGQSTEFGIFLCDGRFPAGDWPSHGTMDTQPVGRFEVDGGGEVWILYRYVSCLPYKPMTGVQPRYLAGQTEADLLATGNRALGMNLNDDGSFVFHDLVVSVTKN